MWDIVTRWKRTLIALALSLPACLPLQAHAAGDLHDLYNALQTRARNVTIPANVMARLGLPSADVAGKEIVVTEADQDQRGLSSFEVAGVPYITMFHIEKYRLDAWWLRFGLDGRILNQKWGQQGYGTFDIASPPVAEREIAFWRQWMTGGAKASPQGSSGH